MPATPKVCCCCPGAWGDKQRSRTPRRRNSGADLGGYGYALGYGLRNEGFSFIGVINIVIMGYWGFMEVALEVLWLRLFSNVIRN